MSTQPDRQRAALDRMAKDDPELAARLILMTLPGAASKIGGTMSYVLDVEELGTLPRVDLGRPCPVDRLESGDDEDVDFRLHADARTLADLVTGAARPARPHDARPAADPRQAAEGDEAPADVRRAS